MSIKHKTRVGFSSAIVVLAAGFAAHTALSSGQVAEPSAAVFRPLSTAGLPQGLLDAAQSQARVAGLDPSTIAEAGVSAAGSPYRATLVARDDGTAYVSFASADAITSFTPATDALADQPMVVLEGTVGTPTELEEVGISIVVDSSVSARAAVSGLARLGPNAAAILRDQTGSVNFFAGDLTAADLTGRTPAEIRQLAAERGYEPYGLPDAEGNFRKFRDPVTKQQRLRIDQGHTDPVTGEPYNNPRAAVPHAHGYDSTGAPIRDPATGDKHFPFR